MKAVPITGEVQESDRTRFWAKTKVSKRKYLIEDNGNKTYCILWAAYAQGGWDHKYGTFGFSNRKVYAHRFSYYMEYGMDPGPSTDHLCHNPLCVNAWHLRGGTIAENNRNRRPVLSQHCRRGHEYDAENTYITSSGTRTCRQCAKYHDKNRYAARYEKEKLKHTHSSEMRDFHAKPKLDWDKVREIRKLSAGGKSQRELSRMYEVSQPMIGLIVRQEAWKWKEDTHSGECAGVGRG